MHRHKASNNASKRGRCHLRERCHVAGQQLSAGLSVSPESLVSFFPPTPGCIIRMETTHTGGRFLMDFPCRDTSLTRRGTAEAMPNASNRTPVVPASSSRGGRFG